jgi:hypothetical protein
MAHPARRHGASVRTRSARCHDYCPPSRSAAGADAGLGGRMRVQSHAGVGDDSARATILTSAQVPGPKSAKDVLSPKDPLPGGVHNRRLGAGGGRRRIGVRPRAVRTHPAAVQNGA